MSDKDAKQKTPVHSVVAVICDILTPLNNEERSRAMEAVATSLGIAPIARVTERAPRPYSQPIDDLAPLSGLLTGTPGARSYSGYGRASVTIGVPRQQRGVVIGPSRVVVGNPSVASLRNPNNRGFTR